MDWRMILAGMLVQMIGRLAPVLMDMVVDWLKAATKDDIVAAAENVRGRTIKQA